MRATILAFAVATFVFAPHARAALVDASASDLRGNGLDVSVLEGGGLGLDPDFFFAEPMDIAIVLEPDDGPTIAWNALVDNLTGEVWSGFVVEVIGAALLPGSAAANAGGIAAIEATPTTALVSLDPAEPAGLDLGAALGSGVDWGVAIRDGGFVLRFRPVAVPEPGTLGAIGIGLVALAARRSGIVRARNA